MRRAVLLLVALGSVGCGSGGTSGAPSPSTPCPSPAAVTDVGLLPSDVPLAEHGVVTEIEVEAGFIGATAVSETQIVELYPPLARALLDAGFEIVSSDNEGFEAEIFFARGREVTGAYRLREGPCPGQVTIKLLYGSEEYEGKKGKGKES